MADVIVEQGDELLSDVQSYLEGQRLRHEPDARQARAWDNFYASYSPIIERAVRRYPLAEPDVRDCVQEIWKDVIVQLPRFRHDPRRARLGTWLRVLARNKAIDLLRSRSRLPVRPLGDLGLDPDLDLLAAVGDPNLSATTADDAAAALRAALRRVEQRTSRLNYRILQGRILGSRSVEEIAAETGLSPPQVWARCHRLKALLRQELLRTQD